MGTSKSCKYKTAILHEKDCSGEVLILFLITWKFGLLDISKPVDKT